MIQSFVRLSQSLIDLSEPSSLAFELHDLGLSRDELFEVLEDLVVGPKIDEPNSQPPSDDLPRGNLIILICSPWQVPISLRVRSIPHFWFHLRQLSQVFYLRISFSPTTN